MIDNPVPVLRCHVVAVTSDREHVLAIPTAAGWLLPCVESNVLPGVLPSVQTMLDGMMSASTIVHAAPLVLDSTHSGEAYCVAVVSGSMRSPAVQPMSPAVLRGTHSLLPIQQQALAISLSRLQKPCAPFDSEANVSSARDWAEQQIVERAKARLLSVSSHRCARYECVLRLETNAGPMYFKGGPERVKDEATLTELLRKLRPSQFPVTLAVDYTNDRWLYRALEGEPLLGPALTMEMAALAACALATLQKDAMRDCAVREHLRERRMTAVEIHRRADQIIRRTFTSSTQPRNQMGEYGRWCEAADRMFERCERLDALHLPMTLVLTDFWTRNILRIPDGIGFIDVGNSYWTYPALSLWRFMNDVEEPLEASGSSRARIERAYAAEWADMIPPANMHVFLADLPFLGSLFSILLASTEWDLEERALGSAGSPSYRATRLSPFLRRIRRTFRSLPS